jgi:uncharacterized membrane-anchored protein
MQYLFYILRWQLSTPLLYLVISVINVDSNLIKTIIANFVGGCIFYHVDKIIFRRYNDDKDNKRNK